MNEKLTPKRIDVARAEIERQSVTDEEVQDAVRTLQEYLADVCNYNWIDYTDESNRLEASARIAIDALREYQLPNKQKSDGYHTFGELYEHRAALFATICHAYKDKAWIADKHADGTMFDDMFLAGVDTPDGVYTYHIKNAHREWYDGIRHIEYAPEWDGHQPKDYPRLFSLMKSEPCKWCKRFEQEIEMVEWKGSNAIAVDIPDNFCPNCGRELEVSDEHAKTNKAAD